MAQWTMACYIDTGILQSTVYGIPLVLGPKGSLVLRRLTAARALNRSYKGACASLMIETLRDLLYQSPRNEGSIVYMGSAQAGCLSSTVCLLGSIRRRCFLQLWKQNQSLPSMLPLGLLPAASAAATTLSCSEIRSSAVTCRPT